MNPSVAYCHVIASVLAADGIMEETERTFLDQTMTSLGLSDEDRQAVIHFEGADEAEATVKKLPTQTKEQLRDDLLAATLADGKISPHESAMVKRLTAILEL